MATASKSRVAHWTNSSGGGWNSALTQFAKASSPRTQLPDGVYLRSDTHTLAIYDGYAKARFHFLVLPRIPFPIDGTSSSATTSTEATAPSTPPPRAPQLMLAGGRLTPGRVATSTGKGTVPASHLSDLRSLIRSPYAADVLAKLREQSEVVVKLVKEEMRQMPWPPAKPTSPEVDQTPCGVEWGVSVGFHAVPSMDTVHLHIISDDLVADRLKHKKHYLSFHPTHGFWLSLDEVERLVKSGAKQLPRTPQQYEALLKQPLSSVYDGKEYANMPRLKTHLEQCWIDLVDARRRESIAVTQT